MSKQPRGTTTVTACDCVGKGLGLDGFHYEGAEGCLRPSAASSAIGETVKRRAALLRLDGASDVDAVTGALRSLTRAERAAWLGETPEELQKGDAWLREAAIKARDRMWARLVLAERAARAEERTEATVALRNFGVDVDASIAAAVSAAARTCVHEKVYSGERHPTGVPQWFWICAKCHGTGADSRTTPPVADFDAFVDLLGHIDPVGAENVRRMRGATKKDDDVRAALRAALTLLSLLGFGAQAKQTDPAEAMGWSAFREGQGDQEHVGSRMRLRQLIRRAMVLADARKRFCESCACDRTVDSTAVAADRKSALGDRASLADDDAPAGPDDPPEFFEHLASDASSVGCAMLSALLTVMSDALDTEHEPSALEAHEDEYQEMLESLLPICSVTERPIVNRAIDWLDAEDH